MILSKPEIINYIDERKLIIDPPVDDNKIAQVSIDLRLGNRFTILKDPPKHLPAIYIERSIWDSKDLWEDIEADSFRLKPGAFVLAQTYEHITMPNDLVGLVEGRSSWARLGITIHVTAPKIDPGFQGRITLEMSNLGRLTVELRPTIDEPAQLMLLRISSAINKENLYGTRAGDLFQGQTSPIPNKPKN